MSIKITTWNINGIRAREAALLRWIEASQPDVLCLQEIKADLSQIPKSLQTLQTHTAFWNGSSKKGYSGTALLVSNALIETHGEATFSIPSFDAESRVVQAVVGKTVIIGVYVPRGEKDEAHYKWKLDFFTAIETHLASLIAAGNEVVLCGDMNVAHKDLDVHPSQQNPDACGQRLPEREAIDRVMQIGLEDVYRNYHPDAAGQFSWWPYWRNARERNLGWRLDYIYATARLAAAATAAVIDSAETSSDHSPVSIDFAI